MKSIIDIGTRWTKGNMDRVYINTRTVFDREINGYKVREFFNKVAQQNAKMYYDLNTSELVITGCGSTARDYAIKAINQMLEED